MNWSPPEETGGAKSISYIIDKLENDLWVIAINTTKTKKTIGYLIAGQSYKFRVRAINKYGISDPLVLEETVVYRDLPSKPQNLRVVEDRGLVVLEWNKPKRDNGSPVISYFVEQKEPPNGVWYSSGIISTELKTTVNKLKVGNVYEFRVSAINGVGRGKPSKVLYFDNYTKFITVLILLN